MYSEVEIISWLGNYDLSVNTKETRVLNAMLGTLDDDLFRKCITYLMDGYITFDQMAAMPEINPVTVNMLLDSVVEQERHLNRIKSVVKDLNVNSYINKIFDTTATSISVKVEYPKVFLDAKDDKKFITFTDMAKKIETHLLSLDSFNGRYAELTKLFNGVDPTLNSQTLINEINKIHTSLIFYYIDYLETNQEYDSITTIGTAYRKLYLDKNVSTTQFNKYLNETMESAALEAAKLEEADKYIDYQDLFVTELTKLQTSSNYKLNINNMYESLSGIIVVKRLLPEFTFGFSVIDFDPNEIAKCKKLQEGFQLLETHINESFTEVSLYTASLDYIR